MPHLAGSTESELTPQFCAEAAFLSYAKARRQMNGYDDQEDLISTQRDLAVGHGKLSSARRLQRPTLSLSRYERFDYEE